MKKYFVYELINSMGTIEHVGESTRPYERFANHIKHKPHKRSGIGKFYGRQDLILNIVSVFDNKKEAYDYQIKLQNSYGLRNDNDTLGDNPNETKLKMSLAKKGKARPQWVKDKIRATMLSKHITIY